MMRGLGRKTLPGTKLTYKDCVSVKAIVLILQINPSCFKIKVSEA
jgi:hypothetical protein